MFRCVFALRVNIAPAFFGRCRSYFPWFVAGDIAAPLSVGIRFSAEFGDNFRLVGWQAGGTVVAAARLTLCCYRLRNADVSTVGRRLIFGPKAPSGDVFGGNPSFLLDDFPTGFSDLSLVVHGTVALGVLGHGRNEKDDCQGD